MFTLGNDESAAAVTIAMAFSVLLAGKDLGIVLAICKEKMATCQKCFFNTCTNLCYEIGVNNKLNSVNSKAM